LRLSRISSTNRRGFMPQTAPADACRYHQGLCEDRFFLYRRCRHHQKPTANLIGLTTEIVAAYVSNSSVPRAELLRLIAEGRPAAGD